MESSKELTNRQKNICEYGGIFGILISLTCLVQHLVAVFPGSLTNSMVLAYLLAILAFLFLLLQKPVSLYLLFVSAFLSLVVEWLWIYHYSFSLVVLMLFIYHVLIIVVLYTEQIPSRLKQLQLLKKAEEDQWRGKI